MSGLLPIRLSTVVLDCPDVKALLDFYVRLLGWGKGYSEGDEWAEIESAPGATVIGFQKNEDYVPPVFPDEPGKQQIMLHLDFEVDVAMKQEATAHAVACGAKVNDTQYSDRWTVFIDPVGHPFCFVWH